jgi:hypothetical protein
MIGAMTPTTGYGSKTRWGKEPVRYQFLRELMIWFRNTEAKTGVGTPTVRGFHQIVGGKGRISWTRFYYTHYLLLVEEGYLSNAPAQGVSALVITQKALEEIDL